MTNRLTRAAPAAPWLTLGGTVALLVGLGWDVALHHLDPSLAAREGVLTLANPSHALVAAGVGLSVAGTLLFLIGRLAAWEGRSAGRRTLLRLGLLGVVALGVASLGLSAWSGIRPGVGHPHAGDGAAAAACVGTVMAPDAHRAGAAPHRHAAVPAPPQAGQACTAASPAD
jgi:hypothetical protein